MRKVIAMLVLTGAGLEVMAQEAQNTSFWQDPVNHPLSPFYGLIALIAIVIFLIVIVAVHMIRVLNALADNLARERARTAGVAYTPKPSIWQRFVRSMNASVPVKEEKGIELDHNYDGIRELDNHLPPWWKYLFYFTIVWAVVYLIAYHVTDSLPLQEDEYENQIVKAEEVKRKYLATQPKLQIDENTLSYSKDDAIIAKGKELYSINCAPCHKADGGGSIGPNLTDEYWIHGGDIKSVFGVIKNGVPEKGMVSWAGVMSPEQLRDVSFFVMSIQGSDPPGAKQPQGTIFNGDPAGASDSTRVQASL